MALQSPQGTDQSDDRVQDQSIVVPTKLITITDSLQDGEISWFTTHQFHPDVLVQVENVNFRAHKYPLISKCGYIRHRDFQPSISDYEYDFKLERFPGGWETFQAVLRFCYSLPIDFTPQNIASLRCASEYLEMTEEMEDGNLIAKTEAFITFVILSSWRDTIAVLKSCENLSPWAENLQIVRRCCDSIAWKASEDSRRSEEEIRDRPAVDDEVDTSKLDEFMASFRIDHFMRIVTAMKAQGSKPEIIGKCIIHYAERYLPGIDEEIEGLRGYGYGKKEITVRIFGQGGEKSDQKAIVESLLSILPPQLESVPCKFLLKMLRTAILYSVTPALISDLEKRIALVLEDASVNDLLIPSYRNQLDQAIYTNSPEECSMHEVDTVQRIIEYFLMHEQQKPHHQKKHQKPKKYTVSKLLDSYLAAIAKDPTLSITKFRVLAESLPEGARTCHDGLYRAIDTYIKTHPSVPEHDRRRLCKVMDCGKLSLDACMHAAQNDRLPLRTVIQVLFSEQIKMRNAMKAKEPATQQSGEENSPYNNQSADKDAEIKTLRAELEKVKAKMAELQSDYSELQNEYEKLSSIKQHHRSRRLSGWASSWRKVKSPFQTKSERDVSDRDPGEDPPQSPVGHIGCRSNFRRRSSISEYICGEHPAFTLLSFF